MKPAIKSIALASGFEACRFARIERANHAGAYFEWLDEGFHGSMEWLKRDPARRSDPSLVLPGARTLIVLAQNYFQGEQQRQVPGRIARYAWGDDYHDLILDQMKPIDEFLSRNGGIQKCYVDTGPILERDYAASSGLAWHGKSTMSLNERLGTWFFLGVILTTIQLEPDEPVRNRCGRCTRCIDACPTDAIVEPYRLDARRCISYLTIENRGSIPIEYRKAIGDRIYGCDDCLDACPWNRFAQKTREIRFNLPNELKSRSLRELALLTEEEFRSLFRHSPIKRIKRNRFIRNICVALGNIGSGGEDIEVLTQLATDSDQLIAEHAAWALLEIQKRQPRKAESSHSGMSQT
jgi:epoxyqueuosine reductase